MAIGLVYADGPESVAPITNQLTKKECGECHFAFQPELLPSRAWLTIMRNLDEHFGESARLLPDQVKEITAYLTTNAGHGNPEKMRITEQRWWYHEHQLPASVWLKPEIQTKSNCPACHDQADAGIYDDDRN